MTSLQIVLILYLLVLLVLPLVVRWRWGLVAALIITVAEVALVVLVFYLLPVYRVFPDDVAGEPPPQASIDIVRRWRERYAVAFFQLVAWAIIPAAAALIGGALSVMWSLGGQQRVGGRRPNEKPDQHDEKGLRSGRTEASVVQWARSPWREVPTPYCQSPATLYGESYADSSNSRC